MTTLVLPEDPELVFRQLHHDLHVFATQSMDDDDALAFMTRLLGHELDFLHPIALPAPQSSERQALQSEGKAKIAGKTIEIPPTIQDEILKLSDEYKLSEVRCLELWFLASDASKREWIERVDQLPIGSIASSIPAAARHFVVSEVEYKLTLLKELMRLRFDERLDKKRRQFVLSYTNKLLSENLLTKILTAFQEQLPQMMEITPLQQAASYWYDLLADSVLFIVSSTRVLPSEIQKLVEALKFLCSRLNSVVAKVSPHIVNLTTFAQLFESGSLAGTSPEGVVKQVSCMLRAMTAVQISLIAVLLDQSESKMDRATGEATTGNALSGPANARVVTDIHRLVFDEQWDQKSYQSVSMLAWAAFLASQIDPSGSNLSSANLLNRAAASGNVFAEVEAAPRVVKAALEKQVFTTMVDVLLKYLPDVKHDPLLYRIFEGQLQLLFVNYSAKLMVDVPTIADQAAIAQMQSESDGEIAAWEGDCLENIVEFAITLCTRDSSFTRSFWPGEDLQGNDNGENIDDANCHEFLLACRDAAFKNPACLPAYLKLVAAAASGPECGQLAFHHVKQNPPILSWDHFFAVMNKYQRLLTEAERPNGYMGPNGAVDNSFNPRSQPGQKFIRPKELEALEAIQAVIQGVIRDQQLALIFFHNHDWSPIQSFVTFLQCRVPSSLKGELMKTLSLFAKVQEIAPFVWRQMDSLQILRTTADVTVYGNQDIGYELEHYESLSRRYPATRGFISLLDELFDHPHAWNSFEGDGRIAAIQHYFDFLLEQVFLKFDLRKYEDDDEKWALVNGVLRIFKKILRQRGSSLAEGGFAYQLLQRLLGGSTLLEKLFYILSTDGGVDSLESTATNVHLEHSFFFCLDYAKKQTEAIHGALSFASETKRRKSFVAPRWSEEGAVPREYSVRHALEILVLVLERDTNFVNSGIQRQLSSRAQLEMLHTALFRYRTEFVNIVQYVKYTKSSYLPHLSIAILRTVSGRVSGNALVDLLVDSGSGGEIMTGYMNRLLNVFEDETEDFDSTLPFEADEESTGNVTFQTPKKRRRGVGSPEADEDSAPITPSTIRCAILDLFLENLEKPAPNLAHLLLGLLNGESAGAGYLSSGLEVLLTLLSRADFGFEFPHLAQRCHRIVHLLLVQDFSSAWVVPLLESSRYEFFPTQLQLFANLYNLKRRRDVAERISELNMRGWFFKALAVYIHIVLQQDLPRLKKVNRIMSMLLLSSGDQDSGRQSRMLLLRLLQDSSLDIYPPDVPSNQHAVTLAEQATAAVDEGCFKWLKIDVERFCEALQAADLESMAGFGFGASKRHRSSINGATVTSATDALLQWAINWNLYSERVAAESHSLNSIRELVEVIVLDYLALRSENDQSIQWQGLDAIASTEVRMELISGIMSAVLMKLADRPTGSAQMFEVMSKIVLLLCSEIRQSFDSFAASESRRRQNNTYLELLYKAICSTSTATGNPVAAQNARTLLYSCVMNVLSVSSSTQSNGIGQDSMSVASSRASYLSGQVVDLICRDTSEGGDVLSMALAVSALESMTGANTATICKTLRERGYLLHFVGLFRKLCEIDAAFDRDSSNDSRGRKQLSQGIDATTIGTIYECFLSLFTRVAGSSDGAIALLEGGLVRVLAEVQNLPSHRPKVIFPGEGAGFANTEALRRAEFVYSRKWLPLVRLVSGLCSALPQNRTLAQQVLRLIGQHRKLFTGCLKVNQHEKPSLNLLRETSYTTFVFRYVTQFQDLCEQELNAVKWEKIAQAILHVFLLYSSEVVPPEDEDQMTDNDSVWWQKTTPRLPNEQRDDSVLRIPTGDVEEALAERSGSVRDVVGLFRLSVFGEEKLYTSRMILCNAVAFCANRMLKSLDAGAVRVIPGKSVLLSASGKKQPGSSLKFPSMDSVDRRTFAASVDPLWSHAPAIQDFAVRLNIAVIALETAKDVGKELHQLRNASQDWPQLRKHEADVAYAQNLIEYHVDSLAFVVENMTIVLLTHFTHFLGHSEVAKAPIHQVLSQVLESLGNIEDNAFVHGIARRLRELASSK
ncbi:hypothetical protein Poli38472_009843 [Pythium oligandrum]|uniref:Nuclear pore complex protein n=1 Tax=Pythium oligandrum TaxID=41045 RepID=A0A8K1CFN9_PYTOL|nr:hypothetical protein Poli38472_009843 [Pythium oligandrum]|eukprot:TMW62350.1 hypothetical protein Poli38472_009843 [Pythium oligandrum]